jgi:hypothetical protein
MKQRAGSAIAASVTAIVTCSVLLDAQRGGGRGQGAPPASARAAAPVDLTGYWVSIVTEDWRFRMVTPAKGDYASVPLNAEGRRVADMWDPSKDGLCDAFGAAGLMRMPGRVHITWQDDNTLKIETDAGQQTRLLHFGPSTGSAPARADSREGAGSATANERTLQGYSAAQWIGGAGGGPVGGFGGFGGNVVAPEAASAAGRGQPTGARGAGAPGAGGGAGNRGGEGGGGQRWGVLRVMTNQLKPAWLRRNGVPYSANTTMTENFMRFADGADEWFTVTTIVEDPTYLNQSFITSTNFKREPDGSKWKPTSCRPSP